MAFPRKVYRAFRCTNPFWAVVCATAILRGRTSHDPRLWRRNSSHCSNTLNSGAFNGCAIPRPPCRSASAFVNGSLIGANGRMIIMLAGVVQPESTRLLPIICPRCQCQRGNSVLSAAAVCIATNSRVARIMANRRAGAVAAEASVPAVLEGIIDAASTT